MSPDQALAAAQVAIYSVLALPTIYIAIRHGVKGYAVVGWVELFLFFSLKLVGSGLLLGSSTTNTSATIISSIGLSPLLLAATGVLHEA